MADTRVNSSEAGETRVYVTKLDVLDPRWVYGPEAQFDPGDFHIAGTVTAAVAEHVVKHLPRVEGYWIDIGL